MPQGLANGGGVSGGAAVKRHEVYLKTDDGMDATIYADDLNVDRFMAILNRKLVMSS